MRRQRFKHWLLESDQLSSRIIFCTLLVFIGLLGSCAIDMYVPSLPNIASNLNVSPASVKLTITLYLASYGVCQIFAGAIIDSFGRTRVLMAAISVGLMGSLFAGLANSLAALYVGRLLQGAGFSMLAVATPAMARDRLTDLQFAQAASILSLAFGLGPLLSPLIGSYIDHLFGWRTVFGFISVYASFVILTLLLIMPETQSLDQRHPFQLKAILKTYKNIITHPIFLKNTLSKTAGYSGFIIFYTVTPFLLQDHMGLTTLQYGWVTLTLSGSTLLAKLINTIILKYIDLDRLNQCSLAVLLLACLLLLGFAFAGKYTVMSVLLPFMLFAMGSGFLFANSTVAAFKPFKNQSSGSIAGLIHGIQILGAFVGSSLAAHIGLSTLLPLGILMVLLSGLGALQYWIIR